MEQDNKSAQVTVRRSKQAEEAKAEARVRRECYPYAEPVIWTDRMLEALEKGVKGGVWFSLIDKAVRMPTLVRAFELVKANDGAAGVDKMSIERFAKSADRYLNELLKELTEGKYRPLPVKRVYIPKGDGKMRPLGIPAVRDRIVQAAVRMVIEPIFEEGFNDHSFGFRPGLGCKDALREVDRLLRSGHHFVVDADLKSYFDTIPHERLMTLVEERIADSRVLRLIELFLTQGIMEDMQLHASETGTPQGGVISPLLANIYLDPLDKLMEARGRQMVRYADDFVIMCRTKEEAENALNEVRAWVTEAGLTLHPEKTRVVNARANGFDFLGYRFERRYKRPRKKSLEKLKDTIRAKTPRTSGQSTSDIIANLNVTLRGWYEYFKHSTRNTFVVLDELVRRRLRSMLMKRNGRKGAPNGNSHWTWPNAYFEGLGLFSLLKAFHLELELHQRQRQH